MTALGLTSSTVKDDAGNDRPLSFAVSPGGEALAGFVDFDGNGEFGPGDELVIAVSIDPPSSSGGFTYTFALLGSINHPLTDDPSTEEVEPSFEDSIVLPIPFQVTDVNGDTAQGSFSVSVVDDIPTIAPVIADIGSAPSPRA